MSNEFARVFLVLSAPSGGGKTTLMKRLLERRADLRRAVTCTTRAPRGGERDGVEYHFLSPEVFEAKVAAGLFLEHATVYGNRYGTLASEVFERMDAGFDVVLSVDVQGVRLIQARARAAEQARLRRALVTVFLTPGEPAELERRLRARGEDALEVVERRLAMAKEEVACWPTFDYLLVSGSMDCDAARLEAILEAEKLRVFRSGPLTSWR